MVSISTAPASQPVGRQVTHQDLAHAEENKFLK
jgi:hypothetical protein